MDESIRARLAWPRGKHMHYATCYMHYATCTTLHGMHMHDSMGSASVASRQAHARHYMGMVRLVWPRGRLGRDVCQAFVQMGHSMGEEPTVRTHSDDLPPPAMVASLAQGPPGDSLGEEHSTHNAVPRFWQRRGTLATCVEV